MIRFAEAVKLEMQQFARDMKEHRYLAHIEEDIAGGERSGVQGIPTFYINGVLYLGSWEKVAFFEFFQSTYEAGATLAQWDCEAVESGEYENNHHHNKEKR